MSASKRYKIKRDLRREESNLGRIAAQGSSFLQKEKKFSGYGGMLGAVLAPIAVASTVMTGGAALPLWAGMAAAAGGYMIGSKLGEETAEAAEKGGFQWGEDKYSGGKDTSYRRSLNSQKFLKKEAKLVKDTMIKEGKTLDAGRYTKSLIAGATWGYAKGGDELKAGVKGLLKGEGAGGLKSALGTSTGFGDLGREYGKAKLERKTKKELAKKLAPVSKKIAKGVMPTMDEAMKTGSLKKGVDAPYLFSESKATKLPDAFKLKTPTGFGETNMFEDLTTAEAKELGLTLPKGLTKEGGEKLIGQDFKNDMTKFGGFGDTMGMPTVGEDRTMAAVIQQNQSGVSRIENMKYNISKIPSKIADAFKSGDTKQSIGGAGSPHSGYGMSIEEAKETGLKGMKPKPGGMWSGEAPPDWSKAQAIHDKGMESMIGVSGVDTGGGMPSSMAGNVFGSEQTVTNLYKKPNPGMYDKPRPQGGMFTGSQLFDAMGNLVGGDYEKEDRRFNFKSGLR